MEKPPKKVKAEPKLTSPSKGAFTDFRESIRFFFLSLPANRSFDATILCTSIHYLHCSTTIQLRSLSKKFIFNPMSLARSLLRANYMKTIWSFTRQDITYKIKLTKKIGSKFEI